MKILLANEATKILHGNLAANKAEKTAEETFKSGGLGIDLPIINVKKNDIKKGIKILDLLVDNKIVSSKSEARRSIKGNGIRINNIILSDETKIVQFNDFKDNLIKISFGKKKHFILKII